MVKELETSNNYWLLRTFSGKYYHHFVHNNYVAIGWNEISNLDVIKKAAEDEKVKEQLLNQAKKLYFKEDKKNKEQPGRIINPIINFVHEMKKGDVVIIPSENSREIHFGIIKDDAQIVKDVINLDEGLEPLFKQRKVEWVAWRDKDSVDLKIFKMLSSHQAISNVNDYADSIDRTMYSLYVKNDMAHAVIRVGKEGEYTGTEIPDLIFSLLNTVDLYNEITGSSFQKNDVKMKISLQSNGILYIFGNPEVIAAILGVAIALAGGGYKYIKKVDKESGTEETQAEVTTSGLISTIAAQIIALRDQKHKHKLEEREQEFRHKIAGLDVKLPSLDGVEGISITQPNNEE